MLVHATSVLAQSGNLLPVVESDRVREVGASDLGESLVVHFLEYFLIDTHAAYLLSLFACMYILIRNRSSQSSTVGYVSMMGHRAQDSLTWGYSR